MRFLVSTTMRAALISAALVSMIATTANAAPQTFLMSATWNSVGASNDPRPLWNPTNPVNSFTLPGLLPANSITGHVLIDQEITGTSMNQGTLWIPRTALPISTQTRGIALAQFGTQLLQLTTRNPGGWPQRGTSPAFDGTSPITLMARPIPTANTGPANFTWCPGAGFACTGAFDPNPANTVMAAMFYAETAGRDRFGGTGGNIRKAPFDGSLGGNLVVRAGTALLQDPTNYQTVAKFSPITALGAPQAAIGAGGAKTVGQSGMTVGAPAVFYSVNADLAGVITKRAPLPIQAGNATLTSPGLDNTRWGAPMTTGTVTLSVAANAAGKAEVNTYMGSDNRVNGSGTLLLVSGMLRSGVNGEQGVSQRVVITMSPEPSVILGAGTALAALLGGAFIANRRRQ